MDRGGIQYRAPMAPDWTNQEGVIFSLDRKSVTRYSHLELEDASMAIDLSSLNIFKKKEEEYTGNPVEAAAERAIARPSIKDEELASRRKVLSDAKGSMLGVERDAINKLTQKLLELDALYINRHYPSLDLSFLKWTKKDGNPVFAVFSLDNPVCELVMGASFVASRRPPSVVDIPIIADQYREFLRREADKLPMFAAKWLTATFSGVIPSETKTKIKTAKNLEVFEHIVIIAEAKWDVRIEIGDPLIVGIKANNAWLIDKFDLSPIENIVASEFTGGNSNGNA